uniref:Uncharacterized protein n=1 Tax=Paramormyrops kingsleyae TaxID=1676925 RepID=A0A3B3RSY3_9TELE
MSYREEAPGQAQDSLEGLYLSAGLGTPRCPPRGAGRGSWGEGGLVLLMLSSALPVPFLAVPIKPSVCPDFLLPMALKGAYPTMRHPAVSRVCAPGGSRVCSNYSAPYGSRAGCSCGAPRGACVSCSCGAPRGACVSCSCCTPRGTCVSCSCSTPRGACVSCGAPQGACGFGSCGACSAPRGSCGACSAPPRFLWRSTRFLFSLPWFLCPLLAHRPRTFLRLLPSPLCSPSATRDSCAPRSGPQGSGFEPLLCHHVCDVCMFSLCCHGVFSRYSSFPKTC